MTKQMLLFFSGTQNHRVNLAMASISRYNYSIMRKFTICLFHGKAMNPNEETHRLVHLEVSGSLLAVYKKCRTSFD
jgi:hypothetical protein